MRQNVRRRLGTAEPDRWLVIIEVIKETKTTSIAASIESGKVERALSWDTLLSDEYSYK